MNLGDYDASAVIYHKFTTFRPSTGAPYTLAGTPAISVYKDNSTTQSTTGVTLTADFDSVTGLNHVAIDTSADGTFYSAGSFFDIVITTGTVDSVSAVGTVVGRFTLRKTSTLKPTTAGRTLDVTATGAAGIDWANVENQSTSVNLSATTTNLVNTLTTYTGNTPQTGDSYAIVNSGTHGNAAIKGYVDDIGVAGAGLTALGDTRLANLDATVSSRSTLTQTQVTGGAYSVQSSSCVLGDARIANLDATVSSRGTSTLTQTQVSGGAYSLASSSFVCGDTRIANLDAAVSSRSTLTQTQVTGGAYALNSASFSFNVQSGIAPTRVNTCQSGSTGTTIVLDASASATDNLYRGCRVKIVSGTGAGQDGRIFESYTGSTQTGTVKPTWITTPDNTSVFVIEAGSVNVEAVLRKATGAAGISDLGTYYNTNSYVPANLTYIQGDQQSATDAKDFFDAGYDPSTNKVQGVVLVDTTTDLTNKGDGSGFTAIPWNASWDAEVQSECTDALTTAVAEGYRATNATGSIRDILYEILAVLTQADISSTTLTTRKLDGTTVAKTYTLNDGTTPTGITETT